MGFGGVSEVSTELVDAPTFQDQSNYLINDDPPYGANGMAGGLIELSGKEA